MLLPSLALGIFAVLAATPATEGPEGVIEGIVFNGTQQDALAAGVEVVLRAPVQGEFVVVAQTATGADGAFRFAPLPLIAPGPYLPGANLNGIHYPGPRISLDASQPRAFARLTVYETAADPSPLVVEDHTILVTAEPGAIRVRETMQISNPSLSCYVGHPMHDGGGPITLQLGIPSDFERITFDKEGFGRQFQLINGKLVTGIPWPPGTRELSFSYVIAHCAGDRIWQRHVDLPSSHVHLQVRTDRASACCLFVAGDVN